MRRLMLSIVLLAVLAPSSGCSPFLRGLGCWPLRAGATPAEQAEYETGRPYRWIPPTSLAVTVIGAIISRIKLRRDKR